MGQSWNCRAVAYGPGDSVLDHTPDGRLYVDEFSLAVRTLEHAVRTQMIPD